MKAAVRPRDLAVGLATFLVVLGVLLHLLMSGRLATTVPVERTTTRSVATDARVLVPGADESTSGVTLERTRIVDPTSAPVPDVDAYVVSTSTALPDGTFVDRDRWTAVQERVSGRVVASPSNTEQSTTFDVNGSTVEERRPLRGLAGQLLRFPRDTAPRDVTRWDPVTRSVGKAAYVGEETVAGRRVLRFEQQGSGTHDDRRTDAVTSLDVRPETGTIVRQEIEVVSRTADGTVALDARFVDVDSDVRAASAAVDRAVRLDRWLVTLAPIALVATGLIALAAIAAGPATRKYQNRRRRPI